MSDEKKRGHDGSDEIRDSRDGNRKPYTLCGWLSEGTLEGWLKNLENTRRRLTSSPVLFLAFSHSYKMYKNKENNLKIKLNQCKIPMTVSPAF